MTDSLAHNWLDGWEFNTCFLVASRRNLATETWSRQVDKVYILSFTVIICTLGGGVNVSSIFNYLYMISEFIVTHCVYEWDTRLHYFWTCGNTQNQSHMHLHSAVYFRLKVDKIQYLLFQTTHCELSHINISTDSTSYLSNQIHLLSTTITN